jgi:hypothetical protein
VIVALKKYNPDSDSVFYTKSFVYPILIIASIISGVANAIVWIAQGQYLSECCTEENKG